MLNLSIEAETALIVAGLTAGSLATLFCIGWTCYLLFVLGRKHVDPTPPILPTRQQQQSSLLPTSTCHEKMAKRNAALLVALSSVRGTVPLPPPSNLVTSANAALFMTGTTMESGNSRKRSHEDVQEEDIETGSWKDSTTGTCRRQMKRALRPSPLPPKTRGIMARTSSATTQTASTTRQSSTKAKQFSIFNTSESPSRRIDAGDPFSQYDKQYQAAFVQREIYSTAEIAARWKMYARNQQKQSRQSASCSSSKTSFDRSNSGPQHV